jgi:hypothetical protein
MLFEAFLEAREADDGELPVPDYRQVSCLDADVEPLKM